jgi:hypothetical protein
MKRRFFIPTVLTCCFMICLVAVTNINGKWSGSVKLPDGNEYPLTYVFTVDGDKLTGTGQAQGEPKAIANCKINGDDFSFDVPDDDGSPIKHSGKYYAAGDSISMNIIYQGTKMHTTLKRSTDK